MSSESPCILAGSVSPPSPLTAGVLSFSVEMVRITRYRNWIDGWMMGGCMHEWMGGQMDGLESDSESS